MVQRIYPFYSEITLKQILFSKIQIQLLMYFNDKQVILLLIRFLYNK